MQCFSKSVGGIVTARGNVRQRPRAFPDSSSTEQARLERESVKYVVAILPNPSRTSGLSGASGERQMKIYPRGKLPACRSLNSRRLEAYATVRYELPPAEKEPANAGSIVAAIAIPDVSRFAIPQSFASTQCAGLVKTKHTRRKVQPPGAGR
jgi:hypothetical protein